MKKLGPYTLLRKMGMGATAEVYLASGPNPGPSDLLALKLMLPHLAEDEAHRARLLQEAQTATLLHHPNLVEIYEVGELDQRPYLAMELVRGWSMSALLKKLKSRGERLTLSESCEVVRQAALGLQYAHEAVDAAGTPLRLVHRDVSPQNIIVAEDGRVKVVDFGLAKAMATQVTQTGGIKGKLPYMPPEQLRSQPIDARADVFALGAVLWELTCGVMLHPGATEAEVFQQALFLPQLHPDEACKDLPRTLVDVLVRAVEREPQRRTASARALAEALSTLTGPDAPERLAARLAAHFEPLPHSAAEATTVSVTASQPRRGTSTDTARAIRGPFTSEPPPPPRRRQTATQTARTQSSDEVTKTAVRAPMSRQTDPAHPVPAGRVQAMLREKWARGAAAVLVLVALAGPWAWATRRGTPTRTVAEAPTAQSPQAKDPESASPSDARAQGGALLAERIAERNMRRQPRASRQAPGTLTVTSNVLAFVRAHGKDLGPTPLTLSLPAGRHELYLETPDHRLSTNVEVLVPAGKTVSRQVTLQ